MTWNRNKPLLSLTVLIKIFSTCENNAILFCYFRISNNPAISMSTYLQLSNKASERVKQVCKSSSVIEDHPVLCKHDLELPEQGLSVEQQNQAWKKVHDYLMLSKPICLDFNIIKISNVVTCSKIFWTCISTTVEILLK